MRDNATALPDGERLATTVTFARRAHFDPVDGYREVVTTDHLLRQSQNAFDQRHPVREIPTLGEEGRQWLGWKCHDEIGDNEPARCTP